MRFVVRGIHVVKSSIIVAVIGGVNLGTASAQGPAIAYPTSSWSYINHSSTYAEGVLRGQASVLAASGELAYLDSLASINYQEAQRRAIDNSVAWTKAYFEKKEIKIEFDKKYGRKALVGEARKKYIEYYLPKKLTADEFNAETGVIQWPHILRQAEYAPIKTEIDQLFANRQFENSGNGSETQRKIAQLVKSMTALVRENIGAMSTDQYIDAQEFLRSIDAEAKATVAPRAENALQSEAGEAAQAVEPDQNQTKTNIPVKKSLKT